MISDIYNTTLILDGGCISNDTSSNVTLEGLNATELQRLIPTIVYLAVLSMAGMLGNSLVCHVYHMRYRLSNSQCFILCLSVIDLFSCAVVIPLELATVTNQYTFEHLWLCKLSRFLNTMCTLSTSFLLLFIAIERHRKVCRPFSWQIKAKVAKFLCLFSVILGLLFSWPAIFIYGKQTFAIPKSSLSGTMCSTDDSMVETIFPLINAAVFGGLFIVGSISVCVLYCFIGHEVRKHAKQMPKRLSIKNSSVYMLSSTMDTKISRGGFELDQNVGNKYDNLTANKASDLRKVSTQRDNKTVWTDLSQFSCSTECCVNDMAPVVETNHAKAWGLKYDGECRLNDVKPSQTDKEEHEEIIRKHSPDNNECTKSDEITNTQDEVSEQRHHVKVHSEINTESEQMSISFETVKENEANADIINVYKADISNDTNIEEILDSEENNKMPKRKLSDTSAEIMIKSENFSSHLFSLGSRISRRMASFVSTANAGSMSVGKMQDMQQRRVRKIAFQMFLISLAFVVSYMPHLLLMIVSQLRDGFEENMTHDGRVVYKLFLRSFFLNCAINPVIYGVCDPRFRNSCKDILTRFCHRGKSHGVI